jgi:uncharacterized protein YjbI with pentapeptide repeats
MNVKLSRSDLSGSNCFRVNFSGASIDFTNLQNATLVEATIDQAILTNCMIYGLSAWALKGTPKKQSNLKITSDEQVNITIDDLEIAQFTYLLFNNQKIRTIIDSLTSKIVLILGRFTFERKVVLDKIREELSKRNYLPIIVDFEKPKNRDFTETISILAHLSRFIIADISNASAVSYELQNIIPNISVPVQLLRETSQLEYAMLSDLRRYPWVLPLFVYSDMAELIQSFDKVIENAEKKVKQLEQIKGSVFTENE